MSGFGGDLKVSLLSSLNEAILNRFRNHGSLAVEDVQVIPSVLNQLYKFNPTLCSFSKRNRSSPSP